MFRVSFDSDQAPFGQAGEIVFMTIPMMTAYRPMALAKIITMSMEMKVDPF